jgi:glycine/D-amino acid oxidase-like deaminating enzyme
MAHIAIIGGGLAGCLAAWTLQRKRHDVTVFDKRLPGAASPVAAGLVNAISGPRFAEVDGAAEAWSTAVAFYGELGRELGIDVFWTGRLIRRFKNLAEQAEAQRRLGAGRLGRWAVSISEDELVLQGGQVDIPGIVAGMRRLLASNWVDAEVRSGDIEMTAEPVRVAGGAFSSVVFCEGWRADGNPWFPEVRLAPVFGECIDLEREPEDVVPVIAGSWVAPFGNGILRCGATYRREFSDVDPTEEAAASLRADAEDMLRRTCRVLRSVAGVRPASADRKPFLMRSRSDPRLWMLNGLGSRGGLYGPALALRLANSIET